MQNWAKKLACTACIVWCVCGVARNSAAELSSGVAWVSRSETYQCCVQQTYLDAQKRLRELAKGEKEGTWCVVLDADETIISNVEFEIELETKNISHSGNAWDEWCNKARATALPGAKEFLALAQQLGGRVIIITNRNGAVKQATMKNLDALGLVYDACLFSEGPYAKDKKKIQRRADLEKGSVATLPAGKTLPPLKILMRAGDQAHDLYDDSKLGFKDVRERFGKDFVILPNPMYGDFLKSTLVK